MFNVPAKTVASPWLKFNAFLLIALYVATAVTTIKPNGDIPVSQIVSMAIDIIVVIFAARGGCFSRVLFFFSTLAWTLALLVALAVPFLAPYHQLKEFGGRLILGTEVGVAAVWFLHVTFLVQATTMARVKRAKRRTPSRRVKANRRRREREEEERRRRRRRSTAKRR